MEVYQGKSVFGGIAMGRLSVYHKTDNAVKRTKITDIEAEKKQNGIINGWKLLIELAINKVGNINKSSDLQTRKETIIKRFIMIWMI